jgi:hypothetical protein
VVVSLRRLQACVGSVCGGGTALMCHGRDLHGWVRQLDSSPSTRRWSVEAYVSQDPHQGATVVFGYIEGSFLVTLIGALSEVWVGGRRGAGSDSDWGEYLRTKDVDRHDPSYPREPL